MGSSYYIKSKIDEALSCFKKANYQDAIFILENLKEKNSNYLISWYLGHSYFRIYDYTAAIKYVKQSIELKTPDELNQSFLGEILLESNNYKEAIKLFSNVLNINDKNINALFNLAKIYSELGKFNDSVHYYNKIIEIEPTNFHALYELIKINREYLTTDKINYIKKFKHQNNLNDVYASFILAENDKDSKKYEDEIINLLDGHISYIKKKERAAFQESNYFTNLLKQFMQKVKETDIDIDCKFSPIFIMGLPRSGTTMIENLISSGDKTIIKGDETGVMGKVFFSKKIIPNYDDSYLSSNFNFSKNGFIDLKKAIFNQYKQIGIDPNKVIFTDKSLENFLYIDLLSIIFPKAKFIYCKRNYVANLLGILKVFLPNLLWCHSLEKIIKFMNLYKDKLTEITSEKKINIKIVDLEDFSNNPLKNAQDLFKFLGIKWNKNVLNFNTKKKLIIKTVSNIQARNKITKHDLNYLKDYIPILEKYGKTKLF